MPMYEYRCNSCNYHFENIQKFSDSDLLTCPKCNTDNLKKLISNSSFSLKGTGWHITDYKKTKPCAGDTECTSKATCANQGTTPPCCQQK